MTAPNTLLEPTVRVEAGEHVPLNYMVRASGEGSTDYRLCRTPWEVRQAYVDCVVGADDPAHKDEIDNVMRQFGDADHWSDDLLRVELYCAIFEVTRFPAGCLARSETRSISGIKLIKEYRRQRDELADILRDIHDRELLGTHPQTYAKVRDVLAKVPTYEQRLRNIAEGLDMTYEELMAAVAAIPEARNDQS